MFHTRYSLFKQVYTHRVGQALEFMLHDIFTMADPVLQISEDMMVCGSMNSTMAFVAFRRCVPVVDFTHLCVMTKKLRGI